jgi:tetratricopeptide (TPR) repeat protein
MCLVVLIAGCTATGCSRLRSGSSPTTGPEPTTAATEEECRAAAAELEQAIRSGDQQRALHAFGLEVLTHRAVAELPVADNLKSELRDVMHRRVNTSAVVEGLLADVRNGGQFKLLRIRPADGRHKATFRIIFPKFSAAYLDVVIARFPSGRVGVEDGIVLVEGDRFTDLLRLDILPAAILRDQSLTDRVSADDQLVLDNSEKVKQLYGAYAGKKWRETITIYNDLPAGLKERKPFLARYTTACINAGRPEQVTALQTCRRRFPGDPGIHVMAFDLHFGRHEYEAAQQALADVRASIGEDPYIDAVESIVLFKRGQTKKAKEQAERAVQTDPELKISYLARLRIAVELNDYADTLEWMKRLVEKTGHDFGNLRRNPAYATFVESPEFRQFLAWRATRQK